MHAVRGYEVAPFLSMKCNPFLRNGDFMAQQLRHLDRSPLTALLQLTDFLEELS